MKAETKKTIIIEMTTDEAFGVKAALEAGIRNSPDLQNKDNSFRKKADDFVAMLTLLGID